jgi:hypothetical protein
LREQAAEQADAGLTEQAQATLDVLKQLNPRSALDPKVRAVELSVFENRVSEAVEVAQAEGEEVEHHANDAGLGEPLAVLVTRPGGVRIGVFAAYSLDGSGRIDVSASDNFVQRAREVDCAAYLFVNGQLDREDLERLAEGIQRDGGQPVGVVSWVSTAQPAPLRPAIDGLLARVRSAQDAQATPPQ